MCNITNGTYAQLHQNMLLLSTCLEEAHASDVYCHWQTPPTSSADVLKIRGSSWVKIGLMGFLLVGPVVLSL